MNRFFNQTFYLIVLVLTLRKAEGSKLNEIVIRSSDQIFAEKQNSNFGSNPVVNGSTLNSTKSSKLWENMGFVEAKALDGCFLGKQTPSALVEATAKHISNLETTIDISHNLIVATKASSLTTRIKDFGHTFLSIKFSSIIGQPAPQPQAQPQQSTTESERNALPPIYPTTTLSQFQQNPATLMNSNFDMSDSRSELFLTATTSPVVTPEDTIIPVPVLKLNADSMDGGHHVIEIAIDSPPNQSQGKSRRKSLFVRKKRALDSEEISQIHKILTLTKTKKKVDVGPPTSSELSSSAQDEVFNRLPSISTEVASPGSKPTSGSGGPADQVQVHVASGKKLSYETWRALMDKSFRPPGFYVTVDDKVVFDNWVGLWQSPNVMGRWMTSSKGVWNETSLLIQYDEIPDRTIKISFEWEPTTPNSYLFLNNITIATFAPNETNAELINVLNINTSTTTPSPNQTDHEEQGQILQSGNRNITLYIVVKSNPTAETGGTNADSKLRTTSTSTPIPRSTTTPETRTSTNPGQSEANKIAKSGSPTSQEKSSVGGESHGNTVLMVSCVTGVLSFGIMVFLIHKKLQVNSRYGNRIC